MTAGSRQVLRVICHWVLLAPFLLLSLVSPNVMPGRAADGTLTLVLCTDGETTEMVIDLVTGKPVEQAPSDRSDRCDWAVGHWTLANLSHPEVPAPILQARPVDPVQVPVTLTLAHATGLPPATGPPPAI